MDIVIINSSRLRVAVNKIVKTKNESSMSGLLTKNGISSSLFSKSERRFETYRHKVHFEVDEFTMYGAIYEDVWQQLFESLELNSADFEIERMKPITNIPSALKSCVDTEIENRISKLEETVIKLMKQVDELQRK